MYSISPTIEEKIKEQTKLDSFLNIYRLSLSEFKWIIPTTTSSKLQKDVVDRRVDFNSNLVNLDVKKAKDLEFSMFSNIADGKLSWTVNKPIVYLDAEEFIKKEATKAITKEVNKFLKGFF